MILKHFQTDISAFPTEEVASQIGHCKLTDFVRFVQLCDPAVARQMIKQIMDACEKCKLWDTFMLLMDLQPHHAHYAIINSSAGPLDWLITSYGFSSPRKRTIYLTELYLLSRFSSSPSQKIREHILSLEPALQAYEPDKSSAKDWDGECNLSTGCSCVNTFTDRSNNAAPNGTVGVQGMDGIEDAIIEDISSDSFTVYVGYC